MENGVLQPDSRAGSQASSDFYVFLQAEGVKQAAKDLLQNQVLENEENMRKLEASMKDKEDQDAKSFNTRKVRAKCLGSTPGLKVTSWLELLR